MIKESLGSITLNITSKCNYNCDYCVSCNKKDLLKIEDVKKIIDDTVNLKTRYFIISGGEPTLKNYYKDVIDYANNGGLFTVLYSNGSMIDSSDVDYIKDNVNITRFTLDSTNPERHDSIKKKGAFNKLMSVIELFSNKEIPVNLNVPVSDANIDDIDNFFEFSINNSVQTMRFAPIVPMSDKKIYQKLIFNIFKSIIKYEKSIFFPDFKQVYDRNTFIEKVSELSCPGGIISSNINSNGEVTVCSFYDDKIEGKVNDDRLFDIWFDNYENNLNKNCRIIDIDIEELLTEVLDDEMWYYSAVRKAVSCWYSEISGKEKQCFRGFPFWQFYFNSKAGEHYE